MVKIKKSMRQSPAVTIADGRPTSPHHATNQQSRNKHQNGIFITSGEIGTDAMHPPGKRTNMNVKAHTANQIRYTREDTAALPYAEDLFQQRVTSDP
jgi:hypothetical protein